MQKPMKAVFREIETICPTLRDADMKQYTTFRIGGTADLLALPESEAQLCAVLAACRKIPHAVMGNGSNLLVGDGGFRGVLLRIGSGFSKIRIEGTTVYAEAGATLFAVAQAARRARLSGMEPLAGIPGSVGGAILMNAGAYDGEISKVLSACTCIFPGGTVETSCDHGFSYRHSRYMEEGAIVTGGVFQLSPGKEEEIAAKMELYAQKRREKQPLSLPSAGSAFKRPPGGYAAQMIDEAGLRGYRVGGAAVSEKHAGFVVNMGGATARDVRTLLEDVQKKVLDSHGVLLEPEIRFLGEFI